MNHSESIIELIKAIALHPKALDALLTASVKQISIQTGEEKEIRDEKKSHLSSSLTSNYFLKPFVKQFENKFSEEEIMRLLNAYRSNEMQKLLQYSDELFTPLYGAIRERIANAL